MRETGPQQMLGGADVISVGEQRPAGRTPMQVHLLFDRHAKVLHDIEPVCDLCRQWRALTGGLCVETTTIPADNLDFGVAAQPLRACVHVAILKDVDNGALFKIDDDIPVRLRFPPAPVINTNDP